MYLEAWGRRHFYKDRAGTASPHGIAIQQFQGIVTGSRRCHWECQDYIDYFLTGNEVERGKPAPDIYLKVAEHLGVQPMTVWYLKTSVRASWRQKMPG